MEETVYNDLIKLCDALIDTALAQLMNIGIYSIWDENRDIETRNSVLIQLRAIASIKDRIEKLHNIHIVLGGTDNETSDS